MLTVAFLTGTLKREPQAGNAGLKPHPVPMTLAVSPKIKMRDVQRFGINLGTWTSWGAEQLASNVIKNPGFEGLVDGSLAVVKWAHGNTVELEGAGVRRPNGFWNDAELDVRTGLSAGRRVRVLRFVGTQDGSNAGSVELNAHLAAEAGDVVALAKVNDAAPPTQWWLSQAEQPCLPGPPRPGSPGRRSLILCPTASQKAEANSFLDMTTTRSGKMLPINGRWKFSVWIRTIRGQPRARILFQRAGSPPFFVRDVAPGHSWRKMSIGFVAVDNGPSGSLELEISVTGPGQIAVDDISLAKAADGDGPFRKEVLAALRELRSGWLRDWQGQLGDTIANRLASAFARRASRYRSEKEEDAKFGYSIPEFLELCWRVRANPWLVLPTTASDEQYVELGAYLARSQRRWRFREILLEFGNENWNPLFGAAGIQDIRRHGEAAARAFRCVRKGSGALTPMRTVVNAQFDNLAADSDLIRESPANVIAVAPYFAYELPAHATAQQQAAILFSGARSRLLQLTETASAHGMEIAVYEVNLHTVGGGAAAEERDRFVLSVLAGSALAMRLIEGLEAGVRWQCVYSLAGFDAYTANRSGFVQLWGVVRDLAEAPRLRATGLALALLNRSMQDTLYEVSFPDLSSSAEIAAVAFRGSRGWSAAIVSRRSEPIDLTITFPGSHMKTAELPEATLGLTGNIDNKRADPAPQAGHTSLVRNTPLPAVRVLVPPYSLVVMLPQEIRSRERAAAGRL